MGSHDEDEVVLLFCVVIMLKVFERWISSRECRYDADERDYCYLHSVISRHDWIVGVDQCALATSYGYCRLQVAALRAWG